MRWRRSGWTRPTPVVVLPAVPQAGVRPDGLVRWQIPGSRRRRRVPQEDGRRLGDGRGQDGDVRVHPQAVFRRHGQAVRAQARFSSMSYCVDYMLFDPVRVAEMLNL